MPDTLFFSTTISTAAALAAYLSILAICAARAFCGEHMTSIFKQAFCAQRLTGNFKKEATMPEGFMACPNCGKRAITRKKYYNPGQFETVCSESCGCVNGEGATEAEAQAKFRQHVLEWIRARRVE